MRKNCKKEGIYLIGKAAEEVTGSQYYINYKHKLLIEWGLYQSSKNSAIDAYVENSKRVPYDLKEVEYIFACHSHIDHTGGIPIAYKLGCNAKIICREGTKNALKYLWENSCMILQKDAATLSKQKGRDYAPLYTMADVENALSHIVVYDDLDTLYTLDTDLKFQWLSNSHCIGAGQLQLIMGLGNETKKILYTSDIGSFNPENAYVDKTEIPNFFNDIVLMETTYADPNRLPTKTRKNEIAVFKEEVLNTLQKNGTVICPMFAYVKTQQLQYEAYYCLKDDKAFGKTPILIDSPLSTNISTKVYPETLKDDDLLEWRKVMNWQNFKYVKDRELSLQYMKDHSSKVIFAPSGFCTAGRVVQHLAQHIADPNSTIILTGYVGGNDAYLGYRIKTQKDKGKIRINGVEYPYRARLIVLNSYSSHANYDELLKYGSKIRTNKLVLVHGDMEVKRAFVEPLKDAISKENKTHQVIVGEQGMYIPLEKC